MTRRFLVAGSAFAGTVVVAAGMFMHIGAQAAPIVESRTFAGKTYYKVTSINPAFDSGNEVCAMIGRKCVGFAQTNNIVCKLFHPNAKTLVSVNGSRYDFYCDGAPQQDIACSRTMDTCQTCPACNPNNDCASPIGQHFREMYVECGGVTPRVSSRPAVKSSKKSSRRSSVRSSRRSSVRKSSVRSVVRRSSSKPRAGLYGPLPMPGGAGTVTCTFSQKPLKKVTCGAFKAADTFCVLVMQSTQAKAIGCQDNGNVICSLPCSAPGSSNLKQCAQGGVKAGSCAPPSASGQQGKGAAGTLCQHGGNCQSGWCLGVVPGREYRCSCIDPTNRWEGCRK